MPTAIAATLAALRRAQAERNRKQLTQARHDTRAWAVKRRERTRQLIELGGLMVKAGLIELADDDRALLFGIMIDAAATLRDADHEHARHLWRRRGKRAFGESPDD